MNNKTRREWRATKGVTMTDPNTPSETPNVVVSNPSVRKAANIVLGVSSIFVAGAVVLDGSSPAFEWSDWTGPASALVLFLAGVFQVAVTTPNIPTK